MTPRAVVEIVVVYNDRQTLERCFLESAGLDEASLVLIDNRSDNVGLPTRFNGHKATSTADWLVFCHQDLVVFDHDWIDMIRELPHDACYGLIGRDEHLEWRGQIVQTDGSTLGTRAHLAEVVGVDELCLIVPRPIYTRIDFDEAFPFDLYAHDYCITARALGFATRIFQTSSQHRSRTVEGDLTSQRFLAAKARFIAKHSVSVPLITTTFDVPPPSTGGHGGVGAAQAQLNACEATLGRLEGQCAALSARVVTVEGERDAALAALQTYTREIMTIAGERDQLRRSESDLGRALAVADAERAAYRQSTSWRITRPLRAVGRVTRRLVGLRTAHGGHGR